MDLTKELRREACKTGVPLTLILHNSGISRRAFYTWEEGSCAPTSRSLAKLETAIQKAKRLHCALESQV